VKILVVDDNADYLFLIKKFLELVCKSDVTTVNSARIALEQLKQSRFDVVVCDFQMPGGSGLDVFEGMRSMGFKTPFFLFTNCERTAIPEFIGDNFMGIYAKSQVSSLCDRIKSIAAFK